MVTIRPAAAAAVAVRAVVSRSCGQTPSLAQSGRDLRSCLFFSQRGRFDLTGRELKLDFPNDLRQNEHVRTRVLVGDLLRVLYCGCVSPLGAQEEINELVSESRNAYLVELYHTEAVPLSLEHLRLQRRRIWMFHKHRLAITGSPSSKFAARSTDSFRFVSESDSAFGIHFRATSSSVFGDLGSTDSSAFFHYLPNFENLSPKSAHKPHLRGEAAGARVVTTNVPNEIRGDRRKSSRTRSGFLPTELRVRLVHIFMISDDVLRGSDLPKSAKRRLYQRRRCLSQHFPHQR